MDSLYDNLENYNDGNVIEELRNENKDLKFKLEERTAAISKLQKDFDCLAVEYKKLEINYSSLLKTARAEVERKTQIITNLNIEKDMMVLSSIQNKNVLNIRRSIPYRQDDSRRKCDVEMQNKNKTKELSDGSKSRSSSGGRKEASHTPSNNTMLNLRSEQQKANSKSLVDNVSEKRDASHNQISDSKENKSGYKQNDSDRFSSRPGGIRSRRKTMPAASFKLSKFSSDEEHEDSSSTTEAKKKDLASKESSSWRNQDRTNNKQDCKEPDNYYRSNRNHDSDKNRSKDRYECTYRLRRHFSPERSHRKPPRDYIEDRHRRFEYTRRRAMESPPRDKFYHQSNKNNFERDYRDFDRHQYQSFHHQERLPLKHKFSSDYDEPSTKRLRSDSYHRHSEDEGRWQWQKEPSHVHSMTEVIQNAEDISCQSPDYMLADSMPTQPIIEIKSTALTALEDPRENSKRYIMRTEHGKKVLSTVTGRNVDMKPVDKLLWNLEQVKVPDALVHDPFQHADDLVKEIYMDIDNPVSNMSIESGENVCPELNIEDHSNKDVLVDNVLKSSESTAKSLKNKEPTKTEMIKKSKEPKYKLPKTKKNDNTKISLPPACNPDGDMTISKNIVGDHELEFGRFKDVSPESNTNKDPAIETRTKQKLCDISTHTNTNKDTVEGDLELSDETSDNMDLQKLVTKEKTHEQFIETKDNMDICKPVGIEKTQEQVTHDTISAIKEIDDDTINQKEDLGNTKRAISKSDKKSKRTSKKQSPVEEAAVDCSNASKKNKTKKKSQTQKAVKEIVKFPESEDEQDKNATAEKEENKVSKEVKSKFCDLFGDSSSLITPEDLGITASHQQTHLPSPNYVPIFEDAQDANDLPTKDKVQAQQRTSDPELTMDKTTNTTQAKSKSKPSKSSDSKKKKSKKNDDKPTVPDTVEPKHINNEIQMIANDQVINTDVQSSTKESVVVKTVIISSGVQPIPTCTVSQPVCLTVTTNSQQTQNYINTTPEALLEALATSTPAKVPPKRLQSETSDFVTPDISNNSLEIKTCAGNITPAMDQTSDSNTVDSQNDVDVPDVRIFVRRRRGKKKVTPSKT